MGVRAAGGCINRDVLAKCVIRRMEIWVGLYSVLVFRKHQIITKPSLLPNFCRLDRKRDTIGVNKGIQNDPCNSYNDKRT